MPLVEPAVEAAPEVVAPAVDPAVVASEVLAPDVADPAVLDPAVPIPLVLAPDEDPALDPMPDVDEVVVPPVVFESLTAPSPEVVVEGEVEVAPDDCVASAEGGVVVGAVPVAALVSLEPLPQPRTSAAKAARRLNLVVFIMSRSLGP